MEVDKEKIQWLEYDLYEEYSHIFAGTFLRHGGISQGNYATLNLGDAVGDHPDSVHFNRGIVKKQIGIKNLIFPKQVHGLEIIQVTKDNLNKTFESDALFTKEKGVGLGITHADCQAALFYDPEHEIIGAAHIGWKGLFQNFYTKIVEYLEKNLHVKPENLVVGIAPSLCPKHSEFKKYKEEVPKIYWDYALENHHFDLWSIAKKQLLDKKVKNIELIEECSFENSKDYFSYRREKITGRNASIIAIL